jgi:hypothetical protein
MTSKTMRRCSSWPTTARAFPDGRIRSAPTCACTSPPPSSRWRWRSTTPASTPSPSPPHCTPTCAWTDIAHAAIEGLQGCDFEDSANGGTLHREHNYEVTFEGEVDRIYNDVVAPLTLIDGNDTLAIEQDGFGDVVTWNPGEQLAARIGDLAPGDHRHFVCVEAAQVVQPVVLAPGDTWAGMQRLG